MATINGTAFNDFIHRLNDGAPGGPSGGGMEFTTVTTGADLIDGGAGSDQIYSDAGNDTVTAGTGADFVFAGAGADSVSGGDDNDTIIGGTGADNLSGGSGYDVFRIQQISDISGLAETIDGGDDVDTLDFSANNAFGPIDLHLAHISNVETLQLSTNDVTMTGAQMGGFASILGAGSTDRIILSAPGTADLTGMVIHSIEEIRGSSGNDHFILTDVSEGQTLNGLGGADTLLGSAVGDFVNGGAGTDTVNGADGNDTLIGGTETDSISGGAGNDDLRFAFVGEISGLAETVDGGADIDTLDFQITGAGGAVDLRLAVISNVETLALAGNDVTLTGAQLGAFSNLFGSGNTDRMIFTGVADLTDATMSGIDEFRGGAGGDTLNLINVTNGQFVNLREGADTIRAGLGSDSLYGGDGDDAILGNAGNDTILGGQGLDNLNGGVGYDVFQIQQASDISGLAEKVTGGSDVDTLTFQSFNAFGAVDLSKVLFSSVEVLALSQNDVTLTAAQMSAFEQFTAGGNVDRLILSAAGTADLTGATFTGIDELRGTSGADGFNLTGVSTGLFVNGLGGADTLRGGDGADLLDGGAANDSLVGSNGADTLIGGLGVDTMTGAAGVDAFRFNDASETLYGVNRDQITDFTHGVDALDLQNVDANTEAAGNQAFTFIAGAAFHHVAGELRAIAGYVQGDLNGDGIAEFQIALTNNATLTAGDIFL